jgi:hypothetical protein
MKLMFTKLLSIRICLFFLIFPLFIAGCKMKVDCPEFDNNLMKWFPYEEGSSITLVNSSSDAKLELEINKVVIEHTTHYISNQKCGSCEDYVEINETTDDLNILIYLNENSIGTEYYLVKGAGFYEYTFFGSYVVDSKEYLDVKVFVNATTNLDYTKLVVAKGFGIIELVDDDNESWVLKQDAIEPIPSVEIKNVSCD